MFHANGWGGPFAITAMGATHVVLRAVDGAEIFRLIEDERRDVRLHGARRAQHDPQLPGQGEAQDHDAAALRRRRRAAACGVHRAAGDGAGLGVHADLRPDGDGADHHRLQPDCDTATARTTRAVRAPASR